MPLKDSDDLRKFRSAAYQPRRVRPAMDMRRTAPRSGIPAIGKTLPPAGPRLTRANPAPSTAHQLLSPSVPATAPRPQPTNPPLQLSDAPRQARRGAAPSVKKRRKIFTVKRIILTLVVLLLLGGGWMAAKVLINTAKIFHGSVFSILTTTKLKGEDVGRVNILLAGNSADDPGHDGANLTDSIMVVSIDTKNNTAFMLSVPRDLWVEIPGYGHAKINEAYVDGQAGNFSAPGYPNGGMGLLEEVIHQNFGLNLNYYALVDYNAVRDAVNAVGGIDVNIQSSDPRGLYDPSIDWATHGPLVKLTNGTHTLNGEQALDLARARGDAYGSYGYLQSDFERTQNQRLMLMALKTKILSAGTLANPIALSNLFDSIGKNVTTDMTLSEARRLYDLGKKINNASITSASLNSANGKNLLVNYTSPTGQSALIPAAGVDDFTQVQAYIVRLTSDSAVTREGATVVVLNGTSTSGLAASAQATLTGKGVNVGAVGDAASPVTSTTIIDASAGKMPGTLGLLKQLYGQNVTTTNPYAGTYTADFIVILGPDQAAKAANAATAQ